MQDAPDSIEAKRLVTDGYDTCAKVYADSRSVSAAPETVVLANRLAPGSRVLDVGCGSGVPVTRALAKLHEVIGVDISARQIALAESNVADATFLHTDIMTQDFAPESFDAIVSYYALFHLSRPEQKELLERFAKWLRPGGLLLATVADEDAPDYVESDFFGVRMYWSHFSLQGYERALASCGFRILESGPVGHGYRPTLANAAEEHTYILAESGPTPRSR